MNCFGWTAMNCTIYTVSYNFITLATHAICMLAFMKYKYNELQVSCATQKLSYKANYKTLFFLIVLKDAQKCTKRGTKGG
jgi:hypothetical protein